MSDSNHSTERREASRGATTHGDTRQRSLPTSRRGFLRAAAGTSAIALGASRTDVVGLAAAADVATPWLDVDGNLIRDQEGARVTLRGVNIADPKRLNVTAPARGKNAQHVVDLLTDTSRGWHAHVIRVPVQPVDIGEHEPGAGPDPVAFTEAELLEYLETHLDPVIEFIRQRGAYAIVDYHRHRDVQWDDPELDREVRLFWDVVAPRYADQSHVLYEVYNEPTQPGIWGDPTTDDHWAGIWRDWRAHAQPWVDIIRSHAPRNLVLIGSPSWTQSPEGALVEPFVGDNLAYTYHIYPGHNASQNLDWEDASGQNNGEGVAGVYEEYPLFVTEFGWQSDINSRYLRGTTSEFGEPFMEWLESSDAIHWTAWIGDPIWLPAMFDRPFTDADDTDSIGNPYEEEVPEECPDLPCQWELLTGEDMGGFVKDTLYALRNDGVPGSGDGGGEEDTTAPTTPSNVTVTGTTRSSVDVDWDASSDDGGSGLSHYNVYVDGVLDHTVAASTTSTTVSGLAGDTSYEIGVSAEDGAGNESDAATVTASTEAESDSAPAIDAFDVTNRSNGGWARVTVDWAVSDADGDLTAVTIEFVQDGVTDSVDYAASGSSASGSDRLQDKKGTGSYDVILTVTDGAGNDTSSTTTVVA